MTTTTNIHKAETITSSATRFGHQNEANTVQAPEIQAGAAEQGQTKGKPESELRAAARRHGLTLKELADRMGVNYGYLSSVASGRRSWTPMLRERAMAVLEGPARVEPAERANRPGGLVKGESCYIREPARELGMSLKELAKLAGVSCGYPSDVARGRKCMSPKVQARVEALLEGPAKVESAPIPSVDCRALWDRMDAQGYSQNEVARLAGIGDARVPHNLPHGKGGPQVRRSTIVIRVRADRLPEFERIAHNKLRGLWVLVESKPLQLLNTASHRLHAKLHTLGA